MPSEKQPIAVRRIPESAIEFLRKEATDYGETNTEAGIVRYGFTKYAEYRGWTWRKPVEDTTKETTDAQ